MPKTWHAAPGGWALLCAPDQAGQPFDFFPAAH
jgi:hypothetical protein